MPVTRGGGRVKISQFCGDIIFEWPLISFSSHCSYISFHIPLNFVKIKTHPTKIKNNSFDFIILLLSIIVLESFERREIIFFCLTLDLKLPQINLLYFSKLFKNISFDINSIALLASSYSPSSHLCCLFILSLSFCRKFQNITHWFLFLLLLISNDIEKNPGPHPGNCLNFMFWNLNSPGKDNFSRIQMIEAHNSLHNYDIISLYVRLA